VLRTPAPLIGALGVMKPQLKAQDCFDHDPIEAWQPVNEESVDYWLCLHIGPPGNQGADMFYVNVLSEAAARHLDASVLAKRKKIVLKDYSWSAVMRAVDDILRQVQGSCWSEVAQTLSLTFDWEFENYQPYEPRP
jgi:Immunity protein 8